MHSHYLSLVFFIVTVTSGQLFGQSIVAHRGSSFIAPENTIAAFQLAWEQNADAIEADFHLTADNQIVCIHDKTTKRTSPEHPDLTVAKASLQQLRKLDVGSWKSKKFAGETIPTLSEVLSTIPAGKKIFVEIKCGPEIVPHLATSLAESKLTTDQIIIICFKANVVKALRDTLPKYKCNWLTSYKNDQKQWKPSKESVTNSIKALKATGLGSQFNPEVVDQSFVKLIQTSGFEFHVWTVDDPLMIKAAIDMKVDSITTNRPDIAIKTRSAMKTKLPNDAGATTSNHNKRKQTGRKPITSDRGVLENR